MTIATAGEAVYTRAVSKKRVVAVGVDLTGAAASKPDLSWAQIALINKEDWSVIGSYQRISGLLDSISLEGLTCPIVLTTGIPKSSLGRIIANRASIAGINDVNAMVRELEEVGGVVSWSTA